MKLDDKNENHTKRSDKRSVFISGPMSGIANHNYSEFDNAERLLHEKGWFPVINPVRFNMEYDQGENEEHGEIEGWNWLSEHPSDLRECFEKEWDAVRKCDAIYLLKGWQHSRGAKIELMEAIKNDKQILLQTEEEK